MIQSLLVFLAVSSVSAFASDVSDCKSDDYTRERIEEAMKERQGALLNTVKNQNGDVVGVLFSSEDGSLDSAFLCGGNTGYYYAKGEVSDLKENSLVLYNDEYDVKVLNGSFDKKAKVARFDIEVAFTGDEEDADYAKFQTTILIDTTPTKELPWHAQTASCEGDLT